MILVTGGAGFIGSHTVVEFLNRDKDVIILDNLYNSAINAVKRIEKITGKTVSFIKGDINDRVLLDKIFAQYSIDIVIHFAGLKAVGESVTKPLFYYQNNVSGTLTLLEAMQKAGVKQMVFSSSATVYGDPKHIPVTEQTPLGQPTNPYGQSKLMIEKILQDLYKADNEWSIALLRYFNPVGAHESGLIGEDPNGIPNNLVPYISQVAIGKLDSLSIYGDDYKTPDGTGIRDYIHVVDLAKGHCHAYDYLQKHTGCFTWNLGTGRGYSVLEVIKAFESASGRKIPYKIKPRRPGDIAKSWADCSKAQKELQWQAAKDIDQMMADAWHWQSKNPKGFS
ncbi:UDP-glucose 4-epimerase GalE [Facilibium subflavum]|nr:UDP-glucose 4-epimerase GalE [Facilibium subflavum]